MYLLIMITCTYFNYKRKGSIGVLEIRGELREEE